jgi:hypothetical protein
LQAEFAEQRAAMVARLEAVVESLDSLCKSDIESAFPVLP